jgi:hypothetical protein
VYEFHIQDLIRHDERWREVWIEFLQSCTVPHQPLPHHSMEEYERTKLSPPKVFSDTIREVILKLRRRWIHRRPRGRRGSAEAEAEVGHEEVPDDGWYPSDGKYCREHGQSPHIRAALTTLNQIFHDNLPPQRGNFFYPTNGYREWHTNRFDPHGWRLYLVHTIPSGCALFRYQNSVNRDETVGRVVDCRDEDGVVRLFQVKGGREALWHCIVSEGQRWSLGVMLSERSAQSMLEIHRLRQGVVVEGIRSGLGLDDPSPPFH